MRKKMRSNSFVNFKDDIAIAEFLLQVIIEFFLPLHRSSTTHIRKKGINEYSLEGFATIPIYWNDVECDE